MLCLFETPAGYALFKVVDESKLANAPAVASALVDAHSAQKLIKLQSFDKFADTTEALAAATALVESSVNKQLKKFLKKNAMSESGNAETLAVADSKLGAAIKDALGIPCVSDSASQELMRGIRSHLEKLLGLDPESSGKQMQAMALGLSHSLSRYKLKFSPDKIDTMIVQAISLLDDLDKELNKYGMRVKEWYGWHFPELVKIVGDNVAYSKLVLRMGMRSNAAAIDLLDMLDSDEALVERIREAAIISMGTEIAEEDLISVQALAQEVISMHEYRAHLFDYLKNRMQAIAPNLTCMVGEIVGARLIAHAGSLMNLAKQPASTVQILGAEKALFRALKTKRETPKYGLIFHASVVGQAAPKYKGKIARVLAAKTALSIRVDALGETEAASVGVDDRARVEQRLHLLEGRQVQALSGNGKSRSKLEKYTSKQGTATATGYNVGGDVVLSSSSAASAAVAAAGVAAVSDATAAPRAEINGNGHAAADGEKKEKKEKKKEKKSEESGDERRHEGKTAESKRSDKSKKREREADSGDEDGGEEKKAKKDKHKHKHKDGEAGDADGKNDSSSRKQSKREK